MPHILLKRCTFETENIIPRMLHPKDTRGIQLTRLLTTVHYIKHNFNDEYWILTFAIQVPKS